MKKDLCELIVVIDESGSMGDVISDTIGGFNSFINTHKSLAGEAKLTLIKFNTEYNIIHNGVNIQDVPDLNNTTYFPGGGTALLDAVGKIIDEVGKRLSNTVDEEKPEKVILLIMTDGEENSSKEYNLEQVKEKIKHQKEKYNWDVIFMGADQDAWAAGSSMNISKTISYNKLQTNKTWMGMSHYSATVRSNKLADVNTSYGMTEDLLNAEIEKMKNEPKNP